MSKSAQLTARSLRRIIRLAQFISVAIALGLGGALLLGAPTAAATVVFGFAAAALSSLSEIFKFNDHGLRPKTALGVLLVVALTVGSVAVLTKVPDPAAADSSRLSATTSSYPQQVSLAARLKLANVPAMKPTDDATLVLGDRPILELTLSNRQQAASNPAILLVLYGAEQVRFAYQSQGEGESSIKLYPGVSIAVGAGTCFSEGAFGDFGLTKVSGTPGSARLTKSSLAMKDEYSRDVRAIGGVEIPALKVGQTYKTAVEILSRVAGNPDPGFEGGAKLHARHSANHDWSTRLDVSPDDSLVMDVKVSLTNCVTKYERTGAIVRVRFVDEISKSRSTAIASVAQSLEGPWVQIGQVEMNWRKGATKPQFEVVRGSTRTYGWSGPPSCDEPTTLTAAPDGIDEIGLSLQPMYGYEPRNPCHFNLDRAARFRVRVNG